MKSTLAVIVTLLSCATHGHAQMPNMENGIECTTVKCKTALTSCFSDPACADVFNAIKAKSDNIGTEYRLSSEDYNSIQGNRRALAVYECGVAAACPNLKVDFDMANGFDCTQAKCPTKITSCFSDSDCAEVFFAIGDRQNTTHTTGGLRYSIKKRF